MTKHRKDTACIKSSCQQQGHSTRAPSCARASSIIMSLFVTAHLRCRASQVPATTCASVSQACESLSSSRDDTGSGCLHCMDIQRLSSRPCRPCREPHPAKGRLHEGDGLALTVKIQRQLLEELLQGTKPCAILGQAPQALPQLRPWRGQQHCWGKHCRQYHSQDPGVGSNTAKCVSALKLQTSPLQTGQHAA